MQVTILLDTRYDLPGFIPDDVLQWLNDNVGECVNGHKSCAVGVGWYLLRIKTEILEHYTFEIADPAKAMLFKLTWG